MGTFPARYPFNSEDGARGCCNGKTFNAVSLECCQDTLLSVGSCAATQAPGTTPPPTCACLNGGTCNTSPYGTTCTCPPGYTGSLCEWGPCNPTPCLNGQCLETAETTGITGSFTCLCDMNWTGQF